MTDETIELNRRRVLGGLITIGGAAAAAGAGTVAYFSDTESSSGNAITTGTLNLELSAGGSGSTSVGVTDARPGDAGYLAIELENSGNLDGTITSVNVGDASGDSFAESLVADTDGTDSEFETDPASDGGELDDNMEVAVFIESSGDFTGTIGANAGSTYTPSNNETPVVSSGTTLSNAVGENSGVGEDLSGATTKVLVFNYEIPGSSTGNEVQGDGVEFDLQVLLEQTTQ